MLALRNGHDSEELDALSAEITMRAIRLSWLGEAQTLCTYLHTGSEVRTSQIVEWALSMGKRVIVPVTVRAEKRMFFSELKDPKQELERRTFGIPEPKPQFQRPVPLEEADVVLVPGVAWDTYGYRVGYGGGYYDRSLNSLKKNIRTIGLTYEFQMVTDLPRTRHDRRVDKLVTEARIMDTAD
jgi:5-formyltetrahydrofolate cyclo-ligase